jgi:hypothetical protein
MSAVGPCELVFSNLSLEASLELCELTAFFEELAF